jgi:sarcosine oxidase
MPSAIVVGAGVFGAALADRLALQGWQVTLVDSRKPGDPRAESGGETRLIRCSHGADELYARSARRARELWLELDPHLLEDVGVAWFARREDGWEAESERVLRSLEIPVERLSPEEGARLFPSLHTEDLSFVLFEPEAGVLHAAKATQALVARARRSGARVLSGEAFPEGAKVWAGGRVLQADAVVWACGAWLERVFPRLIDLRVTLQQLVLFDVPPDWRGPGWVDFDGALYGHARVDPHGLKVASDADGPEVDPSSRPLEAGPQAVAEAREYLAFRFPDLSDAPVASAPACHYSLTADSNFIFAPHPSHDGVWLLGGGSGHGFKHGPALAEHVAAVLSGNAEPEPRFALGARTRSASFRTSGSGQ